MGLAESIRHWTAAELATLLTARSELAVPSPRSLDEIVARATSPYAVQTALQRLDRAGIDVLSAIAFHGGDTTIDAISELAVTPPDRTELEAVVDRLRLLALVERVAGRVIAVPAVLRVLAIPFGLRLPLLRALDRMGKQELADLAVTLGVPVVAGKVGQLRLIVDDVLVPGRIERLVHDAGEGAFDVIGAIDRAGGLVPLSTHRFARAQLPLPIRRLLEFGLLVPYGLDLVELPREVAIVARGGGPVREFLLSPPRPIPADAADRAELAAVTTLSPVEVTDRVASIVVHLGEQPLMGLKSGGVSVKDVKAVAKDLHVGEVDAARLLELAHVAGLIAGSYSGPVQTTADGHAWLQRPAPQRWVHLVRSWALSSTEISRAGSRDHQDRPIAPLSEGPSGQVSAVRRRARLLRRIVDTTTELDAPVSPSSLVAALIFEGGADWSPGEELLEPSARVSGLVESASLIGLLSGGLPTTALRMLTDGSDDDELHAHAAALFPAAVSTFTVQADLTAIAPSELDPAVGGELAVMADPVSRSAVSVVRFTESSLRRALDRSRTVEGILGFLREHARPSVPQALEVLVDDVGRRHGRVRVGSGTSYLRTEDPALLAEITRHRRLAKTGLRVIAPTVAVSDEQPRKLVALLRDAGFFPAADGDGVDISVAPTSDRMLRVATRHRDAAAAWAEGTAAGAGGSGAGGSGAGGSGAGAVAGVVPSRSARAVADLLAKPPRS